MFGKRNYSEVPKFCDCERNCGRELDALDNTFDRRRNVRRKVMQNIVDQYKKEKNKVQNITKLKRKFDIYEPEAVCFSDERFGSKERYNAFGDGMMIYVVSCLLSRISVC